MTTAADRLDTFLAALDRIGTADLEVLSLPVADPDLRAALLARVDEAARAAGRSRPKEIHDARLRVRELMFARFANTGLDVTWAGLSWQSPPNRARERVELILATSTPSASPSRSQRRCPASAGAAGRTSAGAGQSRLR